jgi:hypothetical protein
MVCEARSLHCHFSEFQIALCFSATSHFELQFVGAII